MKLAFLGTPAFAVPVLQALTAEHEVVHVVSRADRRRRRGGAPEPSPVKAAALAAGLPVSSRMAAVSDAEAELGVVVAFGRIVPADLLAKVPMVNLHLSLLPRWRGAAPVHRAILAGDEEAGVCLMQLDEGLDTGPVYGCERTPVEEDDSVEDLTDRLIRLGIPLLLDRLRGGLGTPTPQSGEATYAEKITPAELRLEWSRTATELVRIPRVGPAWTTFRSRRLVVLEARSSDDQLSPGEVAKIGSGVAVGTASGALVLTKVKPEGRGAQAARDWWNGAQPRPGERLE
jgi:methionyl-tRNA formyltransferase